MEEVLKKVASDLSWGYILIAVGLWWGLSAISESLDNFNSHIEDAVGKYSSWVDEQIRVSQLQCPDPSEYDEDDCRCYAMPAPGEPHADYIKGLTEP